MVDRKTLQAPPTDRDLLAAVRSGVQRRLPSSWTFESELPRGSAGTSFAVRAPDGESLRFQVDVKNQVHPRDVPRVERRVREMNNRGEVVVGVLAARYLPASTRERLAEAGLSYVDATGNIRIQADRPALLLADRGADRDPWRGPGRPRGSLRGAPAAKVVRALVDLPGPWTIRNLVDVSTASVGSVYRVLDFLDREGLAQRSDDKSIALPDWAAVLRRWSDDYGFLQSNSVTTWIAPRGIDSFIDRVRASGSGKYAVTGTIAAAEWAPYASARSAMVYCANPQELANECGLRPTETGNNVILAEPAYDALMERTRERGDGLILAAPAQVAVDLMKSPGRGPAEAEELLEWMGRNEDSWR